MSKETALITGASRGIGMHLAHQFAKHGHPVVLVARDEAELREVAQHMRNAHGVEARVIAKDLENPGAAQEIFDELQSTGTSIDILVNNAGHGQLGDFADVPIERHLSLLRLNVEAVLRLTSLFLPPMISRGAGRILNTASVAGFQPGPHFAVYHGTKAFVLSWSESIATELEPRGIAVTALCPGVTDTDFFEEADMEATVAFHKAPKMAPQEVAEIGYKALMKGERVVVTGMANKAMVFSRHLMPEAAQAKFNSKQYEEAAPEDRKRARGDQERAAAQKSGDEALLERKL
jgi:short-subunit dehydrogenase